MGLTGALITPSIVAITGGLLFGFLLFENITSPILSMFGCGATYAAMMVGAAQNLLSKGTKYALFDPTKEMSYIPLDQESKIKGKAAIDVVGARLGKSGGGLILQFILMFGAIMDVVPILFIFVSLIVFIWIKAALTLSSLYQKKLEEQE